MYLYSKWSDKGYLKLGETNAIADMYELIGLHISFCKLGIKGDFDTYYNMEAGNHPYHYRNIGEKAVRSRLTALEISDNTDACYHSRRNFRLLCKTWTNIPVISSDDMGLIFTTLVNIVMESPDTATVFFKSFSPLTKENIFTFQYSFLHKYVLTSGYIDSKKKRDAFRNVLNEWDNSLLFKEK